MRTDKIVFNRFKDRLLEIAVAEGEGLLSLEYSGHEFTVKYICPF